MNQTQSSVLVDPFEEQSILSLNPRTFRPSKDALKSKDLEAIHQHMKSMALQNPDKHFEKAKSVIDGSSEFLNTNKSKPDITEKENPQEHRPGLNRKRAKFSLKPDTSQSSTILEPTLDIDQLQDPEEFFAAFEKFENTKKELKKQRGDVDVDEVKTLTTVRKRRPEIPRRKVSYKHYDYSSQSQDDILVSQETLQDNIKTPQQESLTKVNRDSEEDEITRSIAKTENSVHKLFDELMASKINTLDGNQALSFLKDRMNIKPVDINDLHLPEFHDIPKVDFFSPVKNLLQDSKSTLSDTHGLSDVTKGTQKRLSDNIFQSFGSPTPPKSPFLAISNFGKNILKSISSKDPFSSHDVDSPPISFSKVTETALRGESSHAMLDLLEKEKITKTAIGDVEDREVNMEEMNEDENVTDNQTETDKGKNGNDEDMVEKEVSVTEVNLSVEDTIVEDVEDVREKVVSETLPEVNVDVFEMEDLSQPAQTDANSINNMDTSGRGPTQNLDIVPVQQNEEHPRTKTNKRKKITRKVDLKKKRQSLAEAGSSWTSGVRRSSRITRKPLEYWKGERLLYGRVHNSLPTVIGVKYLSPSKVGFKVESFVADKYKDLVELTALH